MNRVACCSILSKGANGKLSSSTLFSSRRLPLLSTHRSSSTVATSTASEISSSDDTPRLHYDRDTGIIWEGEVSTQQQRQRQPLYQTVIGIEIHAQLSIPTKLFSSAPTRHDNANTKNNPAAANTAVHPYDLAYPGTLPSLSLSAVKASILSAAALNCTIHKTSRFERKHYFYPDLPHGYQITQQRWPLASDGVINFMPHSENKPQKKANKKKKRRRGGDKSQQDEDTSGGQNDSNDTVLGDFEPQPVNLRIERIQLEQDTGKTTTHTAANHEGQTITKSHIDYNRAGCALVEIVSHPDLRSAHEAAGAVERIRKLLKHVGSCDGRMEEGSLRCDLNVSIAPLSRDDKTTNSVSSRGEQLPPDTGHRVEVKNLNSLRQIVAATEYEALRQSLLAQQSAPTGRETRTFHAKPTSESYPLGGETFCIRAKGDAVDYRFMPEPDLPPLVLDEETLGANMSLEEYVQTFLPESPDEARARLVKDYGLMEDVADVITGDPPAIALFEVAVETAKSEILASIESQDTDNKVIEALATLTANLLCNDLFALVKKSAVKDTQQSDDIESALNHPISVEYSTVDGKRLGALVAMVANGSLTASMAKKILAIMYEESELSRLSHPKDIATANGWQVISDMDTLIELCESVVFDAKNSSQLEQYRLGGKKVWKIEKFWNGKIMAASKGNAHPEHMKEALAVVLGKIDTSDT